MNLKYKRHRRMMIWTWFFIVLYSMLVFFLLVHFHQVEYYFNFIFVILLSSCFLLGMFFSIFRNGNNDVMGKNIDKLMFFFVWVAVIFLVVVGSLTWVLNCDYVPIEDAFLIFVILVLWYFLLCFFWEKMVTKNTLLILYFIFYSVFVFPVLSQAISDLGILWKLWNSLFWISPLLLVLFRTSLVDFLGSWFFIRKLFSKKDSEIWNCPQCHSYIMKRPFIFCPHCGNEKDNSKITRNSIYCGCCWFSLKIRDFDFPNYCPHCGLSFRKRKARN